MRQQKIMKGHAREPFDTKPVVVPVDGLITRFKRTQSRLDWHRKSLKPVDSVEVSYEDLIADQDQVFGDLCTFLGVDSFLDVKPEFFKTESEDPKEMIVNYDEVQKALSGTEFEKFLPALVVTKA